MPTQALIVMISAFAGAMVIFGEEERRADTNIERSNAHEMPIP
ncbi:MAG: hypothetical protein R3B58_05225 [Phycisphaerales bacterium]